MTKQNQELSELFGVPEEGLETNCHVSGETGKILKNGKPTGYTIGGKSGHDIIDPCGKLIGIVNSDSGVIIDACGRKTGYCRGGKSGYGIVYIKRK